MPTITPFGVLIGVAIGIVGSLVAYLLVVFWTHLRPVEQLRNRLRKRALRRRIEQDYLSLFAKKRDRGGLIAYYYRDEDAYKKTKFGAPFELLQDNRTQLQAFRAFLIPPLDNGRAGLIRQQSEAESLVSQTADEWERYYKAIGAQSDAQKKMHGSVISKRIVFFDRFLLDFVIRDTQRAIERSQITDDGSLSYPTTVGGLGKFAQYAFRTAYHLITIHRYNRPFNDAVETIFIDKSEIQSNHYYDFGYYDFDGVRLVYMPHFLKSKTKTMVGDKVLLDSNSLQQQYIQEFIDDFEHVYGLYDSAEEQMILDDDLGPVETRNRLVKLSAQSFEDYYYKPVVEILRQLGWSPPAD